ncbi:PAS domain-containing protein [Hymenobacter sp. J193]|uniref:PAS domain-containing sensor histidine kinase n=1 Tax=Hymenobacter sp. J193 TaxID=2898429 RepID=UPI002150E471|nr:PAS domain-containing protein [Hymenobacter sp. J193]MCR5886623.1 PAS domain-containing protein [Hymenobacter sp. J193]
MLPADLGASFPPDDLLLGLLEVSHTGILLYEPIRTDGQITDLDFVLLNSAAQQLLKLPAHPQGTHLQVYPQTLHNGVFAFYRHVLESGEPGRFTLHYQADGLDDHYHLSARRAGQGLLVSVTGTAAHTHSEVEAALRESRAREQAARADAEAQRNRLHNLFMEAPALIAIFQGPEHTFSLVNPRYQQLVGPRAILGKPVREAMPELVGQPVFDLLDHVYRTGETFYATEMLVQLDHTNSGELGKNYYNFIYQPSHSSTGAIDGILVFAYEVTPQVEARRLVEESEQLLRTLNEQLAQTNQDLAASNGELQEANQEIKANNAELSKAQWALQQLNQQLEARVAARTQELQTAQAEAERQRARLERFFMQAPAAICILDGPDLVYELVNPGYQQLFPGRELRGKAIADALPELKEQSIWEILQRVYRTGEAFEGKEVLLHSARYEGAPLEDRYFTFTYQARHDAEGRIDGILVFAYEVTEQVLARQKVAQANEELSLANQQLTRSNQDLDNFVYTASHDLKQPVNNMAGVFEELKRTAVFEDPDAPLLLGMFEGALSQIHRTIQGLVEVVQVKRRHSHVPAEPVALVPLAQSVVRSLHSQIKAQHATVEVDMAAVPVLNFGRLNLQSVLYNLISNALKYAHPERPPHIRVATEQAPDGTPILLVQDNGLGLDLPRYGTDLFQMFRRFHDHVGGSGMGLYLVNRIVQQAGGHIAVESTLGEGTTFRLHLPESRY